MTKNQLKIKSLEKMTAKELRQIALTIDNIVGVYAMNKAELITSIQEARGFINDNQQINKNFIKKIKNKRKKLFSEYSNLRSKKTPTNKVKIKILRKKLSHLKKMTRNFNFAS